MGMSTLLQHMPFFVWFNLLNQRYGVMHTCWIYRYWFNLKIWRPCKKFSESVEMECELRTNSEPIMSLWRHQKSEKTQKNPWKMYQRFIMQAFHQNGKINHQEVYVCYVGLCYQAERKNLIIHAAKLCWSFHLFS